MLIQLILFSACKTYTPYPWMDPVLLEDLVGSNLPPRVVSVQASHTQLYTDDRLQLVPVVEASAELGGVRILYEWHRIEASGPGGGKLVNCMYIYERWN